MIQNRQTLKTSGLAILFALLLALSSLTLSPWPSSSASASAEPKRVLLLFAEDQSFPFMTSLGESIQSTLKTQAPTTRFEFYSEHLDRVRIPDVAYERELVKFWQKKYEARKIDLIVVCVASALDLLSRNRDELFPGVPVVFCVLSEQQVSRMKLAPNVTGVWSAPPFRPTVELALRLHPNTRRVAVVSGSSSFDRDLLEIAKKDFRDFENERLEFTYLVDLTIGELQQKLANLPKDTIVIHLSLSEDRAGVVSTGPEIVPKVAAASNAPVYGISRTYLGSGIVGGSVISYEDMGARAAEIGARILAGERPQDIAPQSVPTAVMFDWREMRRWGISESNLPTGSRVEFVVPSFWDEYKWHLIGVISLVIFQSVLIVGLVMNRIRRKQADTALRQTQAELAHVARVLIVGELAATIAHEVNQPLTAVVANANAARHWLRNDKANTGDLSAAIDDIVVDAHRASEVIGRIRALLKKEAHRTELLDINKVIREVVAIVSNDLLRKNVKLDTDLAAGLPRVESDRIELQQVLLNLVLNGVDAMMGELGRPRNLLLRTVNQDSNTVLVEVVDSGSGITAERLEHIFDAFFTTKPEGMGMGLSICRTIIEVHGGRLWAESIKDQGATFRFTLPTATVIEAKAIEPMPVATLESLR
jgi:signal transduction histidine kinase